MSVTIEIPTALRRFTDGAATLECAAGDFSGVLAQITQRFPGLRPHLQDEKGQVRSFINIYVNEEDIRFLGGAAYQFREGDRVLLVPSIAGGCGPFAEKEDA